MRKEVTLTYNDRPIEVTVENIRNLSENLALKGCYLDTLEPLIEEDLDAITEQLNEG